MTAPSQRSILHICVREVIRPLRDQILRITGYKVESTSKYTEALTLFQTRPFDLVLVDVEGDEGVRAAERLCSEIKTIHHGQLLAFVCNWRIASLTDCPDEIVRTEFDPEAFVQGVHKIFAQHPEAGAGDAQL